jgi:hypothetical protein
MAGRGYTDPREAKPGGVTARTLSNDAGTRIPAPVVVVSLLGGLEPDGWC